MTYPAPPARAALMLSAFALFFSTAQGSLAQTAPVPQPPADARSTRIATLLDQLGQVRAPTTAAISPDGTFVAWAVRGAHGSELHLTGLAPTPPQDAAWDRILSPDTIANVTNLAPGTCSASHPAWSPDGTQLAFLSGCSNEAGPWHATDQDNLFVWTLKNNTLKQVSRLKGRLSALNWSPDGKSIGFLFVENATRSAGALDAMKPWSGVIGEDGVEIQRVYALAIQNGQGGWVTPSKLHVYEFAWAPTSRQIVFVAADPPGENNWWTAKLFTVPDLSGSSDLPIADRDRAVVEILDPTKTPGPLHNLQLAVPRFSPDGKQIAFIGGIMSDQGSTGGDIYLIPATGLKPGEQPRNLTPNRAASSAWITWLDDGSLGVSEHTGGTSHLTAINVATGKDDPGVNLTLPDSIIAGTDTMSISTSHTANVALIRQSFDHAPEVWAGPFNHLTQLTHLNDALKPSWGKAESITYTHDGLNLQGWLLYPADYNPARKYPLIVSVHGGPSSAVTPRWPSAAYGAIPFSALGYFVFLPNPRGSYGQGEKFTQANIKDFGYGDFQDILAGVDLLEQRFPIDRNREGLTGWSYGGFMTMFGVTQTTRFHAAVAGAGISDWQSYYGENSIDQWMTPFFGATVYDDPKIYARSSAIDFIHNVKTPTLIVVGDRDGECPAPQSFEFWHALKAQGVPTQLVIYPNEGHRFSSPEHQRDVLRRALDWFETQMPVRP